MSMLNVKPARAGMRILMPESGYLPMPDEGATVPWSPYYVQLTRHGDLVEIPAVEESATPAKPTAVPVTSKIDATSTASGSSPDETVATK